MNDNNDFQSVVTCRGSRRNNVQQFALSDIHWSRFGVSPPSLGDRQLHLVSANSINQTFYRKRTRGSRGRFTCNQILTEFNRSYNNIVNYFSFDTFFLNTFRIKDQNNNFLGKVERFFFFFNRTQLIRKNYRCFFPIAWRKYNFCDSDHSKFVLIYTLENTFVKNNLEFCACSRMIVENFRFFDGFSTGILE